MLRTQLKKDGINDSWATLRKTLSVQRRLTSSLRRKDGRTIHVRKSTVAEADPALIRGRPPSQVKRTESAAYQTQHGKPCRMLKRESKRTPVRDRPGEAGWRIGP